MKKWFALLLLFAFSIQSFAAVGIELPVRKAADVLLPVGNTGKTVSLQELATMSPKAYEALTGQHLKFTDRMAFKLTQKELKRSINADGTVNVKKLQELNQKMAKAAVDNKKNLRMALILLGAAVVLSIIGSFAPFLWILASLAYLGSVIYFIIWLVNMAA